MFIQEQLILDIYQDGGLHRANIAGICNKNPEMYGPARSVQRRRIQNKVDRWKKWPEMRFSDATRMTIEKHNTQPLLQSSPHKSVCSTTHLSFTPATTHQKETKPTMKLSVAAKYLQQSDYCKYKFV